MKVLVCGGRDFDNFSFLSDELDKIGITHLIHGGAEGADTLAGEWAYMNNIICTRYPALWHIYGKSAGPMRNQQMLDHGRPDLVVAFPGGKGTAHMVSIAKKANVKVIEIDDIQT